MSGGEGGAAGQPSRHRPYLIWGAVLVGLSLLAVALLIPGGASMVLDQRRSMMRTSPDGVAAWARSLERLGVPTAVRYADFDTRPPSGRGLVLLEPLLDLSAGEVRELLDWVRGGGVLVYSPGLRSTLSDSLYLDVHVYPQDPYGMTTYRDSLVEHRWTAEPRGWASGRSVRVSVDPKRPGRWLPLTEDELDGSSAGWLALGEGGIFLLADGGELSNRALADSEIAVTATRAMIDLLAGDTLFFSEHHQGMGGSRGLVRESIALAADLPVGRIALHLGLTAVLLLVLGGRRFGEPLPEPPAARRSTVEHVNAVAHIYRAGRSDRTVAHYLVQAAARRADLAVGGETEEEILRRWSRRPGLDEPLDRALAALGAEPPDLETLEAALDEAVERHFRVRTATRARSTAGARRRDRETHRPATG